MDQISPCLPSYILFQLLLNDCAPESINSLLKLWPAGSPVGISFPNIWEIPVRRADLIDMCGLSSFGNMRTANYMQAMFSQEDALKAL